jgi:O-antigen/teichoic acid export membrane protein
VTGPITSVVSKFFRHGLPYVMISNIAQQGVAFVTVLVVARNLMPEEFALVRLSLAYVAIATVLAAGGITAPVLRYCADVAFQDSDRRSLLGMSVRRVVVISLVVMGAALALAAWWPEDHLQAKVYAAYALQLPGLAAASLVLVYLQAVQRFKALAFYQVAIRLAALILSVVAVVFWGLTGLMVAAVLVAYLSCVPLLALARPQWRPAASFQVPKDFSTLAFYSVFGTVVTALGQYADLIILDVTSAPKAAIAVYSLATVFFFAALALGGAVQSVATPMFTGLMHEPEQFRRRLVRWSALLALAAILVSPVVVGIAWVVETRFLSRDYAGLSDLLAILMLKFFIWSTFAVGGAAMVGLGAIRQGAWIATITTILSVAIGLPLCEQYGVYGAAWTQVLVVLVSAVLILGVVRHEMRLLDHRAHAK